MSKDSKILKDILKAKTLIYLFLSDIIVGILIIYYGILYNIKSNK